MPLDPRTPIVVGVGQVTRRPVPDDDLTEAPEPVDLMASAVRLAADDTGRGGLLDRAQSVRVMQVLSWRYADPGALLAERLGLSPRETVLTATGGNGPQLVVNDTAGAIQRGELDIAVIAGAEAMNSRLTVRKTKVRLPWTTQQATTPARVLGEEKPGSSDLEMSRSAALPTQMYPLFENALRAERGETIDDHAERIARLWARFSEVAASNPFAWSPVERSADEIRTVTPNNRMIGFPYRKLMNANLQTDQAAALIMCSVEAARAASIPEDRWVFVHAGADAADHWYVSERADLVSSPAIRIAGRAALSLAGVGIDEIDHVDLYSCFPAAVQIGASELGLPLDDSDRSLTVTGGLTFAGGPGNNYATHSIASMVEVLRGDPGSFGLATALGWYVTKHSLGVYSTDPPPNGFRHSSPQAEVDALPRREPAAEYEGDATIESYTVMHERDGQPVLGILMCLLPDGRRTVANVRDTDVLTAMTTEEFCGRPARVTRDGAADLA